MRLKVFFHLPYWVSLFQKCFYEHTDVVAHIFNLSFITVSVPTAWLSVIVTPVPKIPKPLTRDFRPNSVIPTLSRLAKTCGVLDQVSPYTEKYH